MTRGFSRHAAVLALAGLFLAGNLGFLIWYRSTAQDRKRGLEARRQTLEREVDTREKEAAVLASQRDRLSRATAAIDEFYGHRIGTPRETLAPIVVELHSVLSKTGVQPLQVSYSTKPMQDLPLSEMQINFAFRNDYTQFKALLGAIESNRKWLVVREVGLNRDPELPGAVQVRMLLATYFVRREGEEPPRPANLLSVVSPPADTAKAAARSAKGGSR